MATSKIYVDIKLKKWALLLLTPLWIIGVKWVPKWAYAVSEPKAKDL